MRTVIVCALLLSGCVRAPSLYTVDAIAPDGSAALKTCGQRFKSLQREAWAQCPKGYQPISGGDEVADYETATYHGPAFGSYRAPSRSSTSATTQLCLVYRCAP